MAGGKEHFLQIPKCEVAWAGPTGWFRATGWRQRHHHAAYASGTPWARPCQGDGKGTRTRARRLHAVAVFTGATFTKIPSANGRGGKGRPPPGPHSRMWVIGRHTRHRREVEWLAPNRSRQKYPLGESVLLRGPLPLGTSNASANWGTGRSRWWDPQLPGAVQVENTEVMRRPALRPQLLPTGPYGDQDSPLAKRLGTKQGPERCKPRPRGALHCPLPASPLPPPPASRKRTHAKHGKIAFRENC